MSGSSRVEEQEVWCLTLREQNPPIVCLWSALSTRPTLSFKERDPSTSNLGTGATQSGGSSASKTSLAHVRCNSLGRSRDSAVSGGEAGGSLKRNVLGNQAARQCRPAVRLSSSRSFSSLNASSLAAAPFMRSSRSLNRLDQRSAGEGTWLLGSPDFFDDYKNP